MTVVIGSCFAGGNFPPAECSRRWFHAARAALAEAEVLGLGPAGYSESEEPEGDEPEGKYPEDP